MHFLRTHKRPEFETVDDDDDDAIIMCVWRLTRQQVKGNDAAVRQELEDAEMKVEQCKVSNWNIYLSI